jgi:UDP-3-O-[3-hydroxymyristoyl] N-acetylglucosamine deacetylase
LQKTLKSDVMFKGVGLHCGRDVSLRVRPAAAQTGIWFRRTDISDADPFISANWQFAVHTALCTRLVNADGLGVSTVEHVMAAIAGCGINNAVVELDGPEVPIMDGSALEFVWGFLKAGLIEQAAPVEVLEILQTVEVDQRMAPTPLSCPLVELRWISQSTSRMRRLASSRKRSISPMEALCMSSATAGHFAEIRMCR